MVSLLTLFSFFLMFYQPSFIIFFTLLDISEDHNNNIYYFILYIQVKTHNEMGYIFITRKILLILIYIHYLFFIYSVHVIEESPSNDHNV